MPQLPHRCWIRKRLSRRYLTGNSSNYCSSSRAVGPHFGLTSKKYQSSETDYKGRISKVGDAGVRTALYEAANVILTRPVKGSDLKTWALGVAKRAGLRKAKVTLARKLAVVLHQMLRDQTSFVTHKAAPLAAA